MNLLLELMPWLITCMITHAGKPEKIFLLSQSWGIISQKIFSEDGQYTVDHSSPVILLKNGKFVARLTHKDNIKQSLRIINKHL